jgi:IS5 family transposase
MHDLSDVEVLNQWIENPYWQYFTGSKYFESDYPCDSSSLTWWRHRIKASGAESLLAETIKSGLRLKMIKATDLNRVNVDTTVQSKDIRFPTDARSYDRMREHLVKQSKKEGIELRQNYNQVSKKVLRKQSNYGHAKQFKRAAKQSKKLCTYLGRVVRDIRRKSSDLSDEMNHLLELADRLLSQKKNSKEKVYSIHEPAVECIAKGKPHRPYEFGCKASIATCSKSNWIVGSLALHGNPYDGHTLNQVIGQITELLGSTPDQIYCDKGYRGHDYNGSAKIDIVNHSRKKIPTSVKKWWKRRSAIEPVIGHLKSEHRLERNKLKGKEGDQINALLSACGFNLKKILKIFFGFEYESIYLPLIIEKCRLYLVNLTHIRIYSLG